MERTILCRKCRKELTASNSSLTDFGLCIDCERELKKKKDRQMTSIKEADKR